MVRLKHILQEEKMKLSAPKQISWIIALVLGILGLLGMLVPTLPLIGGLAFWLVLVGLVLMLLATYLHGL